MSQMNTAEIANNCVALGLAADSRVVEPPMSQVGDDDVQTQARRWCHGRRDCCNSAA